MIIITREQRTPEWYSARCGLPTASEMGGIIQPVKLGYAKPAASTYIDNLIDELVRPEAHGADAWKGNKHTRRGSGLEGEAIGTYAFEAILHSDYAGVMGFTVYAGGTFMLANLLVDIVHGIVDPRGTP